MSRVGTRRSRFWLSLWWFARERALKAVREDYPTEYRDARRAWSHDARLGGALDSPAWNTRGLADDLALHDGADSLLGKQA